MKTSQPRVLLQQPNGNVHSLKGNRLLGAIEDPSGAIARLLLSEMLAP